MLIITAMFSFLQRWWHNSSSAETANTSTLWLETGWSDLFDLCCLTEPISVWPHTQAARQFFFFDNQPGPKANISHCCHKILLHQCYFTPSPYSCIFVWRLSRALTQVCATGYNFHVSFNYQQRWLACGWPGRIRGEWFYLVLSLRPCMTGW